MRRKVTGNVCNQMKKGGEKVKLLNIHENRN